jgi:hypothetical protein
MDDQVPTLTLADLYARQGLLGRAREIYQRVSEGGSLEQRAEAARKLRELGPAAQREIELLRSLMARVQERRRKSSFAR